MTRETFETGSQRERVIICGVLLPDHPTESGGPLAEARALVAAAEGEILGEGTYQRRERPVPATERTPP